MNLAYFLTDVPDVSAAQFAVSLLTGAFLGLFYFGGLWRTLRYLQNAQRLSLIFTVSFFVRTAVTVVVLLWVTSGQWPLLVAALAAFTAVRMIVVRRWGPGSSPGPKGGFDAT